MLIEPWLTVKQYDEKDIYKKCSTIKISLSNKALNLLLSVENPGLFIPKIVLAYSRFVGRTPI
ncbi:hypothetical protein UP17_12595 [Peribacillus simplex]|nr:hypothetical protein UP17_12595 [Peribacillus simplex]